MRTINDIATDMRMLSAYIGGDHYTNKEAESKLKALASELDAVALSMAMASYEYGNVIIKDGLGYSVDVVIQEIHKKHRVEKQS